MGRRLYVGNLSYQVQESELEQLFAQAGSVASVFVPRDKFTGQGRGFAFVEMGTDAEAQVGIEKSRRALPAIEIVTALGPDLLQHAELQQVRGFVARKLVGAAEIPGITRSVPDADGEPST